MSEQDNETNGQQPPEDLEQNNGNVLKPEDNPEPLPPGQFSTDPGKVEDEDAELVEAAALELEKQKAGSLDDDLDLLEAEIQEKKAAPKIDRQKLESAFSDKKTLDEQPEQQPDEDPEEQDEQQAEHKSEQPDQQPEKYSDHQSEQADKKPEEQPEEQPELPDQAPTLDEQEPAQEPIKVEEPDQKVLTEEPTAHHQVQQALSKQVIISAALYQRLITMRVINDPDFANADGDVTLDKHLSQLYMNGRLFIVYVFALSKFTKAKCDKEIEVDQGMLDVVAPDAYLDDSIRQNWFVITTQMEKIGVLVEHDIRDGLVRHEATAVHKLIEKIERYVALICGEADLVDTIQDSEVDGVFQEMPTPVEVRKAVPVRELPSKQSILNQRRSEDQSLNFQEYGYPNDGPSQKQESIGEPLKSVHDSIELTKLSVKDSLQPEPNEYLDQIEKEHPAEPIQPELLASQSVGSVHKSVESLPSEKTPVVVKKRDTKTVKPTVDLLNMQTNLPQGYVENSLEFLLSALSRHFRLKPLTAAGLLTKGNQFLQTAFQQGVKNFGYQPLYALYGELLEYVDILGELMLDEYVAFQNKKQFLEVLKTISSGLVSSQPSLVGLSLIILQKLFRIFDWHDQYKNEIQLLVYEWIVGKDQGNLIDLLIQAIQTHPEVATTNTIQLLDQMSLCREKAKKIYRYDFQLHCKHLTSDHYSSLVMDLLPYIKPKPFCLDDKALPGDEQGSLIQLWLDYALREAEAGNKQTQRIAALALLTELWLEFTDVVDKRGDNLPSLILQLFRKGLKETMKVTKITIYTHLFRLLEQLSSYKNQSAPVLYRAIVYSVCESPGDEIVRELCWSLFKDLYKNQKQIPVDLLAEPLLKILSEVKFQLYEFDYSFLGFLGQHRKLSLKFAIPILQIFQSMIFQRQFFGKPLTNYYTAIVHSFSEEPEIESFALKFTIDSLQMLIEIEKQTPRAPQITNATRTSKYKQIAMQRPPVQDKPLTLQQIDDKFSRGYIYYLLLQLVQSAGERFKEQLTEQIIQARDTLHTNNGIRSQVIERLINLNQVVQVDGTETSQELVPALEQSGQVEIPGMTTTLVLYNGGQNMSTASFFKFKATQHINKLRGTLIEKDIMKTQKQQEEIKAYEKRKLNLKRQVDKRRNELGVAALNESDRPVAIREAQVPTQMSELQIPALYFYDLSVDFEDFEKPGIDIIMKQKAKLWHQLFSQFANKGIYRVKTLQDYGNFDGTKHVNDTITLAEVIKMLKEYKVIPQLISKNDTQSLMKMVAIKLQQANQLQFEYGQYISLMLQLAYNVHYRSAQTVHRHFRAVDCVSRLASHFQMQVEDEVKPESNDNAEQNKIIQQLQETLIENPEYPLPAGYTKIKEKHQSTTHKMPEDMLPFLGRARVLIVPILHDLIDELFQVKILEPQQSFSETHKVKAILKKPKQYVRSTDAVHIIESMKPFGVGGRPRQGFLSPFAKVLLPQNLELKILEQPPEKQDLFSEVAQTVELLVQAVERGSSHIYDSKPDKVVNQAILNQKRLELQAKVQEAEAEKKRIERNERLKERLLKAKNEKLLEKEMQKYAKKDDGRNSPKQPFSPKRPVQASLAGKVKNDKDWQNLRPPTLGPMTPKPQGKFMTDKELAQKRAAESAQKSKTVKKPDTAKLPSVSALNHLKHPSVPQQMHTQVSPKNSPKQLKTLQPLPESSYLKSRAKSVQPNPEGFSRRQSHAKDTLAKMQLAQQAIQQKQEETAKKEQALKNAIKRRTEDSLQQKRAGRNDEHKFELELMEFIERPDVKGVFQKYEKYLDKYFKFYSAQGKVEFGYDMHFRLKNMHFREFTKFGYQTKISPVLLSSEQLMQIFRNVARAQQFQDEQASAVVTEGSSVKEKNVVQFISFESFKKALCRLCIYAHSKLGGYEQDQLEHAIEVEYLQKIKDSKVKDYVLGKDQERKQAFADVVREMKVEFAEFQQKSDQILNRKEGKYEGGVAPERHLARERHDLAYKKWLHQQESLGCGISQRVEERLGLKIEVDPKVAAPHQIVAGTGNAQKQKFAQLQVKGGVNDKLSKNDLRNDHFQTKLKMDINLISAGTVEQLFLFLQMEPGLSDLEIDRRLNQQRIEIQGQKPQLKIKQQKNVGGGVDEDLKKQIEEKVIAKLSKAPLPPKKGTKVNYKWEDGGSPQGSSNRKSVASSRRDSTGKEVLFDESPEKSVVEEAEDDAEESQVIMPHDPEGYLGESADLKLEDALEGQNPKYQVVHHTDSNDNSYEMQSNDEVDEGGLPKQKPINYKGPSQVLS